MATSIRGKDGCMSACVHGSSGYFRGWANAKMFSIVFTAGLLTLVSAQSIPCGTPIVQPATSRIVGGKEATPGSWPYIGLVVDDLGFIAGSATVLGDHVLVTSAQRFEGPGFDVFDLDLRHWRVFLGEHNIHTADPNERYYHFSRVIIHPSFNRFSLVNDVALIITREPIQMNDNVRPICLPDASHQYQVGQVCYLPGWGSTQSTGNEEVLNQVDLPILADTVCQTHWPVDFHPVGEICAGYENGNKDFCGDDIGSPLPCKDLSGQWYIQGIASAGGNCTFANEPGIFEDVPKYSNWIKTTMEQAGYPYQY